MESVSCSTVGAAAVPEPPPPVPGSVCAACTPRSGVSVRLDTASIGEREEGKRNFETGNRNTGMMLPFLLLARVVVGRLECDGPYGSDTRFYVADTANCRVDEMNAAFNEGAALMSYCNMDGWVRCDYMCFPLPFG